MRHERERALALSALLLGACFDAPVERPDTTVSQQTPVKVDLVVKNEVDLLFLIDDSPSMTPKQNELKMRFPQLIRILDQFAQSGSPADYHIGVVTSDLGSGTYPLCTMSKGAKLQARGAAAAAGCAAPSGANFIEYNQITNTSNLPSGTANATELSEVFTCMASVGANGCGFEAQLEAVYKALHDDIPENAGFLRPNALLVVVWLTDEDDCSIPAGSDLVDPAKVADYGILDSYRCTRFSILYDDPNKGPSLMPYNDSGGAVANPRPATAADGNRLTELQKYIDFFKKPKSQGGVKPNPRDVILVGIMGPSTPASSIIANPQVVTTQYSQCTPPSTGYTTSCAPVLQHSCAASQFFGDPAIRIESVITSSVDADHRQLTSICNDSYQMALEGLGNLIVSNIGPGCITSPFPELANPVCVVNDVITRSDGTTGVQLVPQCSTVNGATPCWELYTNPKCQKQCLNPGDPGQQFGIRVNRPDPDPLKDVPEHYVQAYCDTVAILPRDLGADNPLGCQ